MAILLVMRGLVLASANVKSSARVQKFIPANDTVRCDSVQACNFSLTGSTTSEALAHCRAPCVFEEGGGRLDSCANLYFVLTPLL